MYELLLKGVGSPSARDTATRVINFLARQGTNPDVTALMALLSQDVTSEPTRAAVARTVSSLPQGLVKPDELLTLLQSEGTRVEKSTDVAGHLIARLDSARSKAPRREQGCRCQPTPRDG